MEKLIIYTDGASKKNPGPGGWAAIIASKDTVQELGGGEPHATNNRMELMAAFKALESVSAQKPSEIIFRTDSAYVIKGATMWQWGWRKNGWKTKEGKEVVNLELWQQFVSLVNVLGKKILWENVGGHIGLPANERVDSLASSFALGETPQLYLGPRDTYDIDVESVAIDHEKKAKKTASRVRAKQPAYSYISMVNGKVSTHKTWAECEAVVKGKRARFKKSISKEEEAEIIKVFLSSAKGMNQTLDAHL